MKFAYEDLSAEQFERLGVLLCQQLFGPAMQGFAKGPDGGRDAKFIGKANQFPSAAATWEGTTIAQAKHTNGYNRSFSDSDFYSEGSLNTVIGKELLRIKRLRQAGQLDHYILFSNRRLTSLANEKIQAHIACECDLPTSSIYLCGVEQLELWLKQFPQVAELAQLDPIDSPLIVSPDELAELIEALAAQKEAIGAFLETPPIDRISYEKKNAINKMSAPYAHELQSRYLKETEQIRAFLADPQNAQLLIKYESIVSEFQFKIISKRQDHHLFDEVMEHLINLLFNRDPMLRKNKRLTRAFLFYMYWNCDIGEKEDATA